MIELKNHVGELNWSLFPFYALTNWVAAFRAYQLHEINIIIRLWMVTGLIGGASGHFMDLYQVLKVCSYFFSRFLTVPNSFLSGLKSRVSKLTFLT